jgi:hypothetical protein
MDEPTTHTARDVAWAAVQASWGEVSAHQALLSSCNDLEGLAEVGRRYRAVLEARPGDPMALQMKAEIIKRATILGISQLPRTRPPVILSRKFPRKLLIGGALVMASALSWVLAQIFLGAGH